MAGFSIGGPEDNMCQRSMTKDAALGPFQGNKGTCQGWWGTVVPAAAASATAEEEE